MYQYNIMIVSLVLQKSKSVSCGCGRANPSGHQPVFSCFPRVFSRYPAPDPMIPPIIWERLDTWSLTVIPSQICCPRYISATRITVRGISPSLKLVNAPSVHVLRDGKEIILEKEATVEGDLIVLRGGDQVVADCVVVVGSGAAMESLLTGESNAVPKQINSWLYSGSYIVEGRLLAQQVYVGDESYAGSSSFFQLN